MNGVIFQFNDDFEEEPETTIREQFLASGRPMPRDLWELIARLAELNIVVEHTNHLDDATLYSRLLEDIERPVQLPLNAETIVRLSMFEQAASREHAPFDRDRFLPSAEELRCGRGRVPVNFAAGVAQASATESRTA